MSKFGINNKENLNNQQNQHPNQPIPQPIPQDSDALISALKTFVPIALIGLSGYLLSFRYKASNPNEYIAKTGLFVQNIQISKKTIQLPLQQVYYIDLTPQSYNFILHSMSKEKMEFLLPCVFTIGPKDDEEYLQNFSKFLLFEEAKKVEDIIKGMIEGETRVLAANMSIEDIFKSRTEFKNSIIHNVESELRKFGLTVFNANIKELSDSAEGSKYFKFLSQKVSADAENQAKIDIAEAQKIGMVGEKQREGEQRQRVIEIEASTKIFENTKSEEIMKSTTELDKKRQEYNQIVKIAEIESQKNAERRQEEMQKEVEIQRLARETEKQRAEQFSKAKVEAEVKSEEAKGESSAIKQLADASLYQQERKSDGFLYSKMKESEGIKAIYNAQAQGLNALVTSFQGDTSAALKYMMIEKDLYQKLAKESAQAIQGLNPKINIWNTGSSPDQSFNSISNIMKSIPPILDVINSQTDIKVPDQLLKQQNSDQKVESDKK